MSEEAINRLLKREIGCTIHEINAIIGYWLEKYDKEKMRRKELQEENAELKQKLAILSVRPAIPTTKEKLKYRIDKAIEYIEDTHVSVTQCEIGTGLLNTKDYLLEILKGDNE